MMIDYYYYFILFFFLLDSSLFQDCTRRCCLRLIDSNIDDWSCLNYLFYKLYTEIDCFYFIACTKLMYCLEFCQCTVMRKIEEKSLKSTIRITKKENGQELIKYDVRIPGYAMEFVTSSTPRILQLLSNWKY